MYQISEQQRIQLLNIAQEAPTKFGAHILNILGSLKKIEMKMPEVKQPEVKVEKVEEQKEG